MTNTLDLNKMGLAPMSNLEMQEVDGGNFWHWLAGVGLIAIIVGIAALALPVVGAGVIAVSIGIAASES